MTKLKLIKGEGKKTSKVLTLLDLQYWEARMTNDLSKPPEPYRCPHLEIIGPQMTCSCKEFFCPDAP